MRPQARCPLSSLPLPLGLLLLAQLLGAVLLVGRRHLQGIGRRELGKIPLVRVAIIVGVRRLRRLLRLQELGLPFDAIVRDREGLRTITTMARAAVVFGVKKAQIVTNGFHMARAVYLARSHGIDAVGVPAPALRTYSWRTMARNVGREALARLFAVYEIEVAGVAAAASTPR